MRSEASRRIQSRLAPLSTARRCFTISSCSPIRSYTCWAVSSGNAAALVVICEMAHAVCEMLDVVIGTPRWVATSVWTTREWGCERALS